MTELSLCMIVKNEEERLARCLSGVQGAVDEIVIVDTGSTDGTKRVARQFTTRVYDYAWDDDFSAARNASLDRATKPFILWLDADDVVERSEKEKLMALKNRLTADVDAVMTPYHTGIGQDGRPTLIYERERMTARDSYYYAREWMDWGDPGMAERAFAQFLAMPDGWIENRIDAYIQRAECLQRLGRRAEARQSLLASLALGAPRAEALCALGDLEMEESAWKAAAFWYRAAMLCRPPEGGGFVRPELYDYVPAMQLCVCYDRMGQYRLAAQMNERALLLHPGDAAALANRRYFETRFSEPKTEQKKEKQG